MIQRKLNDFQSCFLNPLINENPVIYKFDNIIPEENDEHLLYGITTVYPGDINGEYYMTKGHKHKKSTSEIYLCLSGQGIVLQECDNDIITTTISPDTLVYCQPNYAHRLINTGDSELKVLCICRADAGHDYSQSFSSRFLKGDKI